MKTPKTNTPKEDIKQVRCEDKEPSPKMKLPEEKEEELGEKE